MEPSLAIDFTIKDILKFCNASHCSFFVVRLWHLNLHLSIFNVSRETLSVEALLVTHTRETLKLVPTLIVFWDGKKQFSLSRWQVGLMRTRYPEVTIYRKQMLVKVPSDLLESFY